MKKYFDSIPHQKLASLLAGKFKDKALLYIAKCFLEDELLLTLKEETIGTIFLLLTLLQIDGVDARN